MTEIASAASEAAPSVAGRTSGYDQVIGFDESEVALIIAGPPSTVAADPLSEEVIRGTQDALASYAAATASPPESPPLTRSRGAPRQGR